MPRSIASLRTLLASLLLALVSLGVCATAHAADPDTRGLLPDEQQFRETVRLLRSEIFSGWPSLRGPIEGDAGARPVDVDLARPLAPDEEKPGGIRLAGAYAVASVRIARAVNPDEETRAAFEAAFETLRDWLLEEGDEWLVKHGFVPEENIWPDSRCIRLFPARRGEGFHGITFWLLKTYEGADRTGWALELTALGAENAHGWSVLRIREFLASRQENVGLMPFAEWFAAQEFADDDIVVSVDAERLRFVKETDLEWCLGGMPTRRTARVLIQRGDELRELVAPVAGCGPGLVQRLHERGASGELDSRDYVQQLAGFDWYLLGDVLAQMDSDRPNGFSNWIVGLPSPGGVYRVRPNPLSRNEDTRWQRMVIVEDRISLRIVLYSGKNPISRSLEGYLRNFLRAVLDESGAEWEYDSVISFTDGRPDGSTDWQYCLDLEMRDTELAAALRECRGAEFETVSGDPTDGWGTARLKDTGETFEGFFENGLPAGVMRRENPETGAILVGRFRGVSLAGPFFEFDPGREVARIGVAEGREVREERRIASWKGADGKGLFRTRDGLEQGPVVAERGTVISGDPRDGRCVVAIPGLGKFTGSFVNGVAQGQGVLETPEGHVSKIDCYDGIPRLVKTLKSPGTERLEFYEKFGQRSFPLGDCLSGDIRKGEGVAFIGYTSATQKPMVFRGSFLHERPHGRGTLSFGDTEMKGLWRNGLFVPPPPPPAAEPRSAPEPEPRPAPETEYRYVDLPVDRSCRSCGGYGYKTTQPYWVDEVEVRPFMPGQRGYGSWIWSGYEVKTGRRVKKPGRAFPCRYCGGNGLFMGRG